MVVSARGGCAAVRSWSCNDGYGNTVLVRAADGTCARFEHLETIAVAAGRSLTLGARIGNVGSSGRSTGPHLHYQREDCDTHRSLPSTFAEAGAPRGGTTVTSRLPASPRM